MRDAPAGNIYLNSTSQEITHFHVCSGVGGFAKGFNMANPRVGSLRGHYRCLGGVDSHPGAIANFNRIAGVKGTVLDLFTRAQYEKFHSHPPPAGWREATPEDIRRAAGYERPNVVCISTPCKGATGLISSELAETDKYMAYNELTVRAVWLICEAWKDEGGIDICVFENVPGLAHRARYLLDQIKQLWHAYGFSANETKHNCGHLGNLAQSRERFLMVARNLARVPTFLYVPERKPLRPVSDILERMPLPGDTAAGGPMHRIPRLQWQTWVRLSLVEAGSDWRSLNKLNVEDGFLKDYLLVPEYRSGFLGVQRWDESMGTIAGRTGPTNGAFSVADPRRFGPPAHSNEGRVGPWDEPSRVVTSAHGTGHCVADPRFNQSTRWNDGRALGVKSWSQSMGTIAGQQSPGQGGYSIADPRMPDTGATHKNVYRVVRWGGPAGTITAAHAPSGGAACVADPRIAPQGASTPGQQDGLAPACTGGSVDLVADAAPAALPGKKDKLVAFIRAEDGTWHRPVTTLETAAFQGLFDPAEHWSSDPQVMSEIAERNRRLGWDGLTLIGNDSEQREHVGNMVPPPAACAMAEEIGETLLLAKAGESFTLSCKQIWVRPLALALTLPPSAEQFDLP